MNQDLVPESENQLEVQEHVDCVINVQNLRNLRVESMARVPAHRLQAKLIDKSPEVTPQATDEEDGSQENDGVRLPSMALLPPWTLSEARTISKMKKPCSSAAISLGEPDLLDYGDFDIMDRQRPSIQRGGNMKSRHLNTESCDMTLESHMQQVWEGDRAKKKLRKQARENLRSLGLLDKKGKGKLKPQNSQGLPLSGVGEQIKNFLQSSEKR